MEDQRSEPLSETLEALAELSVGRACGFASIGILILMLGLSDQMQLSLKVGGLIGLGMCSVLIVRAMLANRLSYKRTEVWIMLKPGERPSSATAQQLISRTLRRVYFRFALKVACVSAGFLTSSLVLSLFGHRPI